jgi:K+-transporting ATPase KdpF subunit
MELLTRLLTRFLHQRHQRFAKSMLLALLTAAAMAPAVQAATGGVADRGQSLAIVLLGLTTLALSVYLFVVIFQPERF